MFGEAYELYWKQVYTLLATGPAGGAFGKGLAVLFDTGKIVASFIVGGIALIAIAALGLLFAAWASADPIAYDLMVYDLLSLYKLTTPGSAVPLQDAGGIAYITWSRLPQGIFPNVRDDGGLSGRKAIPFSRRGKQIRAQFQD